MTRRELFKKLLLTPIAAIIGVKLAKTEAFTWDKTRIDFYDSELPNRISMYGIPYHENNATTGYWLGFDRGAWMHPAQHECYKEIADLVNILETDKKTNARR